VFFVLGFSFFFVPRRHTSTINNTARSKPSYCEGFQDVEGKFEKMQQQLEEVTHELKEVQIKV
jgi:hypothetical protein